MRSIDVGALAVVATLACLATQAIALPSILVFTKTSVGAYRHDSIPTAVDVITRLGTGALVLSSGDVDGRLANDARKWKVTASEEDGLWTESDAYLSQFDAVVFVSTSDLADGSTSVLSDASRASFARYIQQGGGFVGVHSASACLYTTPFFGRLVGAFFDYHPEIQEVGIRPLTVDNPSTSSFPDPLTIYEEVYHYRTDPRSVPSSPTVLLSNATAFDDPQAATRNRTDGPAPRPLAWVRSGGLLDAPVQPLGEGMDDPAEGPTYSGGPGRMFYTSLGHENATWGQSVFQGHVAGGIAWVLASSTVRTNNDSATVGQPGSGNGSSDSPSSTSPSDNTGANQARRLSSPVAALLALALLPTLLL